MFLVWTWPFPEQYKYVPFKRMQPFDYKQSRNGVQTASVIVTTSFVWHPLRMQHRYNPGYGHFGSRKRACPRESTLTPPVCKESVLRNIKERWESHRWRTVKVMCPADMNFHPRIYIQVWFVRTVSTTKNPHGCVPITVVIKVNLPFYLQIWRQVDVVYEAVIPNYSLFTIFFPKSHHCS